MSGGHLLSRLGRILLRASGLLKLLQQAGGTGEDVVPEASTASLLSLDAVLEPCAPVQHNWQQLVTHHITLVMGASIVIECILAIEECRLCELPVWETKQNLYPDFNDKAWHEDSAKKTWFVFHTAYPAVPFRGNLLQNSYTCLFMLGTHKCKEMLAEPLISLIKDK